MNCLSSSHFWINQSLGSLLQLPHHNWPPQPWHQQNFCNMWCITMKDGCCLVIWPNMGKHKTCCLQEPATTWCRTALPHPQTRDVIHHSCAQEMAKWLVRLTFHSLHWSPHAPELRSTERSIETTGTLDGVYVPIWLQHQLHLQGRQLRSRCLIKATKHSRWAFLYHCRHLWDMLQPFFCTRHKRQILHWPLVQSSCVQPRPWNDRPQTKHHLQKWIDFHQPKTDHTEAQKLTGIPLPPCTQQSQALQQWEIIQHVTGWFLLAQHVQRPCQCLCPLLCKLSTQQKPNGKTGRSTSSLTYTW